MRQKLREIGSKTRHRYRGTFKRYGFKVAFGHAKITMVLTDIYLIDDDGKNLSFVTDHLWFNLTKGFMELGILKEGEVISFNGRVSTYQKKETSSGHGKMTEFKLERPTKILLETDLIESAKREKWIGEHWKICNQVWSMNEKYYVEKGIPKPYDSY